MTRITFTEGAVSMAKGLVGAGILGAAFQYLSREVSSLTGETKENAERISTIVGRIACFSWLVVTTGCLLSHIYYKTSPSEICNERTRGFILSLFPQLKA